MEIKDYTDEILDRRFALVRVTNGAYILDNDSHFWRCPQGAWGIPGEFTIREGRDGLPLPEVCKHWDEKNRVILSKTSLEKLRRLKPGKRAQMRNDRHDHNNWWALRLDDESENNINGRVDTKDAELRKVQAKIKKLAGNLIKQERKLRKELRTLRDEQMKG